MYTKEFLTKISKTDKPTKNGAAKKTVQSNKNGAVTNDSTVFLVRSEELGVVRAGNLMRN